MIDKLHLTSLIVFLMFGVLGVFTTHSAWMQRIATVGALSSVSVFFGLIMYKIWS